MPKVIILRHGQSEGNVNRPVYNTKPTRDIQLTEKGRQQAFDVGVEIARNHRLYQSNYCFVSPYDRTKDTYTAFREGVLSLEPRTHFEYMEEPLIREWDWGSFWTMKEQPDYSFENAIKDDFPLDPFFYRFKGGESGAELYDRAFLFYETRFRRFLQKCTLGDTVILVTHGNFIRSFLQAMLMKTVQWHDDLKHFRNCEYMIFHYFKETDHFHLEKGEFKFIDGSKYNTMDAGI